MSFIDFKLCFVYCYSLSCLLYLENKGGKSNQNQSDLKLIPSKIYTSSDFIFFFINFFNNATTLKIHM